MRRSVESLEEGTRLTGAALTRRVDLGLALLSVAREPGERLTTEDIAAWCECSPQAIQRIEARALAKMRGKLMAGIDRQNVAREVESMLATFGRAV